MSGDEIKLVLQKHGITQSSLAKRLNMSPALLNNRLSVKMVKQDFQKQIEDAIGFSLDSEEQKGKDDNSYLLKEMIDKIMKENELLKIKNSELHDTLTELKMENAVLRVQLSQYTDVEKVLQAV